MNRAKTIRCRTAPVRGTKSGRKVTAALTIRIRRAGGITFRRNSPRGRIPFISHFTTKTRDATGHRPELSPVVRDFLGLNVTYVTDLQFVVFKVVPHCPWSKLVENNTFVIADRNA